MQKNVPFILEIPNLKAVSTVQLENMTLTLASVLKHVIYAFQASVLKLSVRRKMKHF